MLETSSPSRRSRLFGTRYVQTWALPLTYSRHNGPSGRRFSAVGAVTPRDRGGKDTAMVTVFLVDDHEVVRRGLIDLLSADPDLDVIGEAGSVAQALARIPDCSQTSPCSMSGCPTATASNCAAICCHDCPIFAA